MKPPTAEELVGRPPHCLDEQQVLSNFLGKSRGEAEEMFRSRPSIGEDFMWMAPPGLCYYLPAALSYLESEESNGDFEFPPFLMSSLAFQAEHGLRGEALALAKKIAEVCDVHRARFEFTSDNLFLGSLKTIKMTDPGAALDGRDS